VAHDAPQTAEVVADDPVVAGPRALRLGVCLFEIVAEAFESLYHLRCVLLDTSKKSGFLAGSLDLHLERLARNRLHKSEKLADVVPVGDEVDLGEVEVGALGAESAKQRLERRARVAGGVLIDVHHA
jgi:hypothetical protein